MLVDVSCDVIRRQVIAIALAAATTPDSGDAPGYTRELRDRGLDLPQLDPVSLDLDLQIVPADERQPPVPGPPHEVAGTVDARVSAERRFRGIPAVCLGLKPIRKKPVGGEIVPVQVPGREACPADTELADRTYRHRPELRVDDISGHVGQNRPDARIRRAPRVLERLHGGKNRRLGRAVDMHDPGASVTEAAEPGHEHVDVPRLASDEHISERGDPGRAAGERDLHEGRKRRWRLVQDGNPGSVHRA